MRGINLPGHYYIGSNLLPIAGKSQLTDAIYLFIYEPQISEREI